MRQPVRRRLAEAPLYTLCAVAAVFASGLAILVATGTMPADPLADCRTVAATLAARLTTVGILTPAAVLAVVIVAAGLALGHQAWATRRVLRKVLACRRPAPRRLRNLAAAAGLEDRFDVVADEAVYTFCYGLLRPRVCVSSGLVDLLEDQELAAVLRHEAHHARQRDPLKIVLARTVSSALFFLPLAGALRNSFLAGKEICADGDALTDGDEMALAQALVKMLAGDRPVWPAGVLAIGAMSPTEARIQHLLEPRTARPGLPSAVDWIVSAALVAGIFGFSYGSAAAQTDAGLQTVCTPAAWAVSPATTAGFSTNVSVVAPSRYLPVAVVVEPTIARALPVAAEVTAARVTMPVPSRDGLHNGGHAASASGQPSLPTGSSPRN